jgi:NAD(P)H-hydrate epimerase
MPEPIVTVAQMRQREERTWAAGISQESVIRRAGLAVAEVVSRLTADGDPVLVLVGRGNNGADATVAEQHLAERDSVLLRFESPQAFETLQQWLESQRGNRRALIIDGLFGIGLNRPLEGRWREAVEMVNACGLRLVAVDVPSGLNADTGEPMGAALEADVTVTLGAVKTGLIRESAARWVGRLELAGEIGLLPETAGGDHLWTLPSDFGALPPRRPAPAHKGRFGHLAVVAGSVGFHGAGVLAAQAALRARPGLVTVFTDEGCYVPVASQLQAAMVRPWKGETIADEEFTAIVLGPGLASPGLPPSVREEARRLWRTTRRIVVADASALDWMPPGRLEPGAGPRVITPHPGEAARLLNSTAEVVQADRFQAIRNLAQRWDSRRVEVVLKGRHTVVGGSEGPLFVNPSGNPGLAQGGSGDVLAGFLGGWLAQPALQENLVLALRYAVWRHGAAADRLEAQGAHWTTEDLVDALAAPT